MFLFELFEAVTFRILKECLVPHADDSITGADAGPIVARMIGRRGTPSRIRSNNGSEFICEALVNWLPGLWAESIPVAAGSPWEHGHIESFQSRLRDEFLECRIRGCGGCQGAGVW